MNLQENLYKIFLFTSLEDEIEIFNSFRLGFRDIKCYINIINHNIDIAINDKCRLAAITINRRFNNKVNEFFNEQIKLIYSHFYVVKTNKINEKLQLLEDIKKFNYMYDIEFIAESKEWAARIIGCLLDTCKYCNGVLLNFDGSKFVNADNKLILDDEGNSDL